MDKKIRELTEKAIQTAAEAGKFSLAAIPPVAIELSKEKGHGDFSTNAAMVLAKKIKVPPQIVAQTIIENLPESKEIIERVEVAGAGFINFFLSERFFQESLREMASKPGRFFPRQTKREKVLLEFVSANPTGPLNVVNARAAAVGDTMARLLRACGTQADREFYVNDEGSQIVNLGLSVEARYIELVSERIPDFIRPEDGKIIRMSFISNPPRWLEDAKIPPEDLYQGEYVKEIAKQFRDGFANHEIFFDLGEKIYGKKIFTGKLLESLRDGFEKNLPKVLPDFEMRNKFLARAAIIWNVSQQKNVLERFGLFFESWYFQSQLGERVKKIIAVLEERGHTYNQEDAVWFRSTVFQDDKDRVLVRATGEPTYFAADIAYHAYKKERGYDRLIDLLGPDHHGYIARTKAAIEALGYPAESIEIFIIQLVTLMSGGKPLRMSKRVGEFITMEELLDEVGVDAARWYFLNRHRNSHLEFDLDLAKLQSEENPLYYAQYAHARICSIIRKASEQGINVPLVSEVDLSSLTHEAEKELIKKMSQWESILEMAAINREPHHLPRYAVELARTFHSFYTQCPVLGEKEGSDTSVRAARLFLISACKDILAEVFAMMGVSAPLKM